MCENQIFHTKTDCKYRLAGRSVVMDLSSAQKSTNYGGWDYHA